MTPGTDRGGRLAAVTGANGFIGEALATRLAPGRPVRALFRAENERSRALAQAGCDIVIGDLDDRRALAALVAGADEVYHCAATMAKRDPELSWRVNVQGTERVARAARVAGVRRFVYVSSTSVHAAGARPDCTYEETVQPENVERLNHYSRSKYEGEQVVGRLAAEVGLRFTIVRPTNVYGLRSRPWFGQWDALLRRVPVAFGTVEIDLVYVSDLVAALEAAAASPAAEGEVFNVGHEMIAMSRFVAEIGRVVGRRARTLPPRADRWVSAAIDRGFRAVTGTTMSPSLVHPAFYPHAKARTVFGYEPQYPLGRAMAEIARLYGAR